jgi:hypothetical protein
MIRTLGWMGLLGILAAAAHGQVVGPVGSEFQVNTYTVDIQGSPAACGTGDGRFVVVWDGGESMRTEIFAQLYASNGTPTGSEFQVNTYTDGQQEQPSVCCDAVGDFVVTWRQEDDQDGDGSGVFGQRFSSGGGFIGTEFQVSTSTAGNQGYEAICCGADGNFVVSWESYDQDGDRNGIFAQRFANSGALAGAEFQVNTYTENRQRGPAVACSAAGDFVVAWSSYGQDGDSRGIFGQRFAVNGTFLGAEFLANTYTLADQRSVEMCRDANGAFVLAWESTGQDGSGTGIFGQRFDSAGLPSGSEFQASATAAGNQQDPAICCGSGGDFVVAWDRATSEYQIFARRFAGSGDVGGDVPVSFATDAYQTDPAVVCRDGGGFAVVWQKAEADGDSFGVFGRLFAITGVNAAPVLSWLGLVVVVAGLMAIGAKTLLRRI